MYVLQWKSVEIETLTQRKSVLQAVFIPCTKQTLGAVYCLSLFVCGALLSIGVRWFIEFLVYRTRAIITRS